MTATLTSPSGRPLLCRDLGQAAAGKLGLAAEDPIEIALQPKTSKAGNTYYAWDLNGLPLPDGLATGVIVNGARVSTGAPRESKRGNQMVTGETEVEIADLSYQVSVTIVRTRRPYWVNVVAHVKPRRPPKP